MKKYFWGILYGLLLTAFTAYVLMDTFVIARVYTAAPSDNNNGGSVIIEKDDVDTDNGENDIAETDNGENDDIDTDNSGTGQESSPPILTANSYTDDNISITITEYREHDTTIYSADVRLSSAEYLRTALAKGAYGKNVTDKTSVIAKENSAILAINGDYYGAQEKGYVLRNGILYRGTASSGREDLVIYKDGSFGIITEKSVSADDLLNTGAQQVLSFGPALVMDGQISVTENEEVGKAKTDNPRTAIGIIDELHYVFAVSDGRTNESKGLTLYELAEFIQSIGAKTAYNLDGGGSSTMVFNGEVINNPTTSGKSIKERSVSDIVYIGY